MKKNIFSMKKYLFLLGFLPLFTACDHIAEGNELIKVDNQQSIGDDVTTTTKTVLLEDFTGQMCVYCPNGTLVIEELQEAYGDHFIGVGIHGGPLGFKGNATNLGLATQLGDDYYSHWQIPSQPYGLIDRGSPTNYTDWMSAVVKDMKMLSHTKMELDARLNGSQIDITVREQRLSSGTYQGKMQLWVLEDGIVAAQKMPDGTTNRSYVHNHVLRTATNGMWGEDITLQQGETRQQVYAQPVDAAWNTDNLSIVAFLYNSTGVEQALKVHVEH